MSRKTLLALGVLAAAALSAAPAAAADHGYVTANLNLRAGPGTDYPVVATMQAGSGVTIYGCLSGWTWCDIDWRGNRGWAAGSYLQVMYRDRRQPITSYGSYIGLPFVTFSVGSYWGDHYRHRRFYDQLPRWNGHRPHGSYDGPRHNKPHHRDQDHKMYPGNNPPDRNINDRPHHNMNIRPDHIMKPAYKPSNKFQPPKRHERSNAKPSHQGRPDRNDCKPNEPNCR